MSELTVEDIATMRAEGSLREYFQLLTGRPASTAPKAAASEPTDPGYHVARPGAWPCGTAATGPTPPPCTHPAA
ncbi:hypothetical protein [Streptomyces sp. NPDC058291]|uniref:hypothetical protein n=1 Tax=Streptomyces sp. NPDC058291 TaxID=3346427 RepID=UPI0036E7CE2C